MSSPLHQETTSRGEVLVFSNEQAIAEAATPMVIDFLEARAKEAGRATLVLSGGGTPKPLYERLAREAPASLWKRVHIFFGDDRCVPPGHEDSNYRLAQTTILGDIDIPEANIHRIEGEREPNEAASRYETLLREFFDDADPDFDVQILGVGDDGHTASLFPESPTLDEKDRWVIASVGPPEMPVRDRVTMTFPAINASRLGLVLVAGEGKKPALHASLFADDPPPGGRLAAHEMRWLVDSAAWGQGRES